MPVTAVGLFLVGFGTGTWDVAMNVEGAEVERLLDRSIMPRFHASFSLGTVAGAAIGALVTYAGVGIGWHVGVVGVLVAGARRASRARLPAARAARRGGQAAPATR